MRSYRAVAHGATDTIEPPGSICGPMIDMPTFCWDRTWHDRTGWRKDSQRFLHACVEVDQLLQFLQCNLTWISESGANHGSEAMADLTVDREIVNESDEEGGGSLRAGGDE